MKYFIFKCTDIPAVRKINGGTVLKITYEPEAKTTYQTQKHCLCNRG